MRAKVVMGMVILWFAFAVTQRARATAGPEDPCSLLKALQVSSTLGDNYAAPEKSVAPRPFADTAQGTDCQYKTVSGKGQVLFRVYFDASAAQAADLHARLKMFFGKDSTPARVGDEAYVDEKGAIHVRKGNARYFVSISQGDVPDVRKKVLVLATLVAGEL